MNTSAESRKSRKCMGCLKTLLILLVLLLAVLHVAAPRVVRSAANQKLPEILNTPASLDGVELNLARGRVGLSGLMIQQPGELEGDPLLQLGRFSVEAPLGKAIRQDPVTVNHLRVHDLYLRVVSDAEGVLNVTRLGPPAEAGEETTGQPETATGEPAPPVEAPPVWVREIVLQNLNLIFEDLAKDWIFQIADMNLTLRDVQINSPKGPKGPGTLEGSLQILGEELHARVRLLGKIGGITPDQPERIPPIQLAVGVIGFNLDLVEPFMVPGARTAFGGGGFDFQMLLEIGEGGSPAEQTLFGSYALTTDQGHRYAGELGGTVESPSLPFLNIFGDVLGNQFGRITSLGGNLASGGAEAAKAAAETTTAAVTGAATAVRGAAGGLLRTARGVVTLDSEAVSGGLRDATVGTVENVSGTVSDTVGTATAGVSRAASTATGAEAVRAWWTGVPVRVEAFELGAREWMESRAFPK